MKIFWSASIWMRSSNQSNFICTKMYFAWKCFSLNECKIFRKKLTVANKSSNKLEIESPYLQKLSHSNFLNGIFLYNNRSNGTSNLNSFRTLKTTSRMNSRANSALAHRPSSQLQTAHTVASMTKFEPYNRNETNSGIFLDSNQKLQLQSLSFRRERPSSAPVKGFVRFIYSFSKEDKIRWN